MQQKRYLLNKKNRLYLVHTGCKRTVLNDNTDKHRLCYKNNKIPQAFQN